MIKIAEHAKEHGFNEIPKELLAKVKANIKDHEQKLREECFIN